MGRDFFGFAGCVIGAGLVAVGLYSYTPGWIFMAGGLAAAACGLLSLGGWGAGLLAVAGLWVLVSSAIGWARQPWNLLVMGIAILGLGFMAGALRARAPSLVEADDDG